MGSVAQHWLRIGCVREQRCILWDDDGAACFDDPERQLRQSLCKPVVYRLHRGDTPIAERPRSPTVFSGLSVPSMDCLNHSATVLERGVDAAVHLDAGPTEV